MNDYSRLRSLSEAFICVLHFSVCIVMRAFSRQMNPKKAAQTQTHTLKYNKQLIVFLCLNVANNVRDYFNTNIQRRTLYGCVVLFCCAVTIPFGTMFLFLFLQLFIVVANVIYRHKNCIQSNIHWHGNGL